MRVTKEHDERKQEILDTAEQLFLSKGYDKTTINDILKTIGIAKGTFYYYFKSKEEVLDAVIMRVVEEDMKTARAIRNDQTLTALEKIIHFLLKQSSEDNQQKSEMLEQFPKVENIRMKQRALESTIQYVCPILAEIIDEGNQQEEFHTAFPLEAIQFLIAGIQFLLDEKMTPQTAEAVEKRILSFIDIIFKVLGIDETQINKEATIEQLQKVLAQ